MFHTQLVIADREVAAADARTFDRIDPMTGAVATRAAAAGVSDAIKAADAAAAAFPEWSAMPPGARRRFGGSTAIDEFTELRWITIQSEPMHSPF